MEIDERLAQINQKLKAANVGVSIERRGGTLWLRGTFPPKPGSSKTKPYRQKLALGVKATSAGIQHAEKQARLLGAELNLGKFSWDNWGASDQADERTIGDWIREFEADYWNRRKRTSQSETTWEKDYLVVLNRLNNQFKNNQLLTPEILLETISQTQPDSRNRKRTVMVLGKLAKFAALEVDFSGLSGSYSPKHVNPRSLPTDTAIQDVRASIQNEAWRFVVGAIACYGLRPHEVFHLDVSEFPIVEVLEETKTGTRFVYPLYPEWAEQWELNEVKLPNLGDYSNAKLGTKIAKWIYEHKLPFVAYDLRHCYARRCFEFDIPPDLAAGLMGHSIQVHLETYRAWIDRATYRRAYEKLIHRGDRPLPPQR